MLTLCTILVISFVAYATNENTATIFSLEGEVTVTREGKKIQANESMQLLNGDEVSVAKPGLVALQLADGSYIRLPGGSTIRFPAEERSLGLLAGVMHFFSHSEQHPTVITEHVTAAIRGTEFTVAVNKDETTIQVLSGAVNGTSPEGVASLNSGQGAKFRRGSAPQLYSILSSERAVQWSLFTPLLGSEEDLNHLEKGGVSAQQAVLNARAGDIAEALADLSTKSESICSAASVLRGRLLIVSGDREGGAAVLNGCVTASQKLSPQEASYRAIAAGTLSIVRLMQGDLSSAEKLSQEAISKEKGLASAKIARSFSLQERGDLEEALEVIGAANASDDYDLIARRAELLFMFGRVPEARKELEQIPTRSWYGDTVLGFVLMADRSFAEAEVLFTRAAAAESGAGLPQVGLGLLSVNRGDLSKGRQHFERATVLEPSRAIYRSYLGKSYFEADSYSPADPEYRRAIELDKNDPTPYLYRSFMRLAENRPVEALRDIEAARDRSENRSVYRSRFRLDEDAAVQSASLSRTYRDLGFFERGKVEAIAAIISDYRNASAHRLLSESQENPFSADTSLSERRISNLFSPLSINVIDSIGSSVSLNEYSSLFERDGWRTGVSSSYASLNDIGQTGIVAANKSGNLVTGLSASGIVSRGLDSAPRSAGGRVGVSLQAQPNWQDRFFVEGRGIIEDSRDSIDDVQFDGGSFALGASRRFSPDVTALVQSTFSRDREKLSQIGIDEQLDFITFSQGERDRQIVEALVDAQTDRYTSLWVNEGQLVARTSFLTSLFTLRSATTRGDLSDTRVVLADETGVLDGQELPLTSAAPVNFQSFTASYLGMISLTPEWFLNLGGSFERVGWSTFDEPPFDESTESRSRVNPKAGIIFKPSARALFRVGYGESLGKGINLDLASVEPTLIGGITQRFNDNPGTFSRNLGFGVDLQPGERSYVGTEWIHRWLDESRGNNLYQVSLDFDEGAIERDIAKNLTTIPISQDIVTSYWYQVLNDQWVTGFDYRYAMESQSGLDSASLRDQKARAFQRYFLTQGIFLQGSSAYRYQGRANDLTVIGDSSGGWLFGFGVGYRMPTRGGIVLAEVDNIFGANLNLVQGRYFQDVIGNDPMVKLSVNLNF
jgi:tetratricopeptide (TPR) repeat protein